MSGEACRYGVRRRVAVRQFGVHVGGQELGQGLPVAVPVPHWQVRRQAAPPPRRPAQLGRYLLDRAGRLQQQVNRWQVTEVVPAPAAVRPADPARDMADADQPRHFVGCEPVRHTDKQRLDAIRRAGRVR